MWKHILGEAEYLDRCTKRTRSVVNFSKSEELYESILTGFLSSIPRGSYARALDETNIRDGRSRTAESSAALLESTREIIKWNSFTVEYFVNMGANQDKIRLSLYAALIRTSLYLSEKNLRYPWNFSALFTRIAPKPTEPPHSFI